MPLIDIKTKFKSLKFGNDRPDGGNSGQPYIIKGIPDERTTYGGDSLIRGGGLNVQRRADDLGRFTKFFTDPNNPKGVFFIGKQELLAQLNPKKPKDIGPEKIYTPTNTLAQIPVTGTGYHFMKDGLSPFLNDQDTYEKRVLLSYNTDTTNRLVILRDTKLLGNRVNQTGVDFGISNNNQFILDYIGGPNSGPLKPNTKVKRVSNTNIAGGNTLTLEQVAAKTPFKDSFFLAPPEDFRTQVNRVADTDYKEFNRAKTYKIGNPGYRGKDRTDPDSKAVDLDTVDQITYSPVFKELNSKGYKVEEDIVPFFIKTYDNDNVLEDTIVQFRAFVTGFSDDYSAEWNPFRYMGRGENFYTYQGFTRQISLSLSVHAQSRPELLRMYQKLNYLASTLTPDYSNAGFMRGNFSELTFGDYLVSTPGIITNLSFRIPDESPWEIGRNRVGENTNEGNKLPHLIEISNFTFIPIHSFLPSKELLSDVYTNESRYISLGAT